MCGFFINVMGYKTTKIPYSDPALYDVWTDKDLPVKFITKEKVILEVNRHYVSDLRTGPRIVDLIYPRDGYILPYLFHDSGCTFGGYWIDGKFTRYTRAEVDDLLYDMVLSEALKYAAQGENWLTTQWRVMRAYQDAYTIWAVVRVAGASHWRKGDKKGTINAINTNNQT